MVEQNAGYLFMPYAHGEEMDRVKNDLRKSDAVSEMYFATMSFAKGLEAYFPQKSSRYLVSRFDDKKDMRKIADVSRQDGYSFTFSKNELIFQKEMTERVKFLSAYYFEQDMSGSDILDVANILSKSARIRSAEFADLEVYSKEERRFEFPYKSRVVLVDISKGDTPSMQANHCEKLRRDACRKGLVMSSLMNMPMLETIK